MHVLEFLKKILVKYRRYIGKILVNIGKISVNISNILVNIGYFDLNQIQRLELHHNVFLTIQ